VLALLLRRPAGWISLALLVLLYGASFLGPLLDHHSATATHPLHALLGPSWLHPLGTDDLGRDELLRMLYGGRVSLSVGLISMVVALVAGLLVGGLAGYLRGAVETILMRLVDAFMAIPAFFLILAELAVFGSSPPVVILVVGLSFWGQMARVVFAESLKMRQREFIEAAQALGASRTRVFFRHLLPQVVPSAIVLGTLGVGWSILTEAALSFLGLGIQPPLASWGNMLQNAQVYVWTSPWLAIYPGLAIALAVLAFNLLGNALRDVLDPRIR
jgi:peptide/nickel transport system permease protein